MVSAATKEYETVMVLDPTLSEPAAKSHLAKIEEFIREHGGKEVEVGNWGRRDIPHRAKKFKVGGYVCFAYKTESRELQNEIARSLRIDPNVIKFQTHRIGARIRKPKFSTRLKRLAEAESSEFEMGADA